MAFLSLSCRGHFPLYLPYIIRQIDAQNGCIQGAGSFRAISGTFVVFLGHNS